MVILITSLSVRYFKAKFHSLRNFLSRIIRLSLLSLKKEKEKKIWKRNEFIFKTVGNEEMIKPMVSRKKRKKGKESERRE